MELIGKLLSVLIAEAWVSVQCSRIFTKNSEPPISTKDSNGVHWVFTS